MSVYSLTGASSGLGFRPAIIPRTGLGAGSGPASGEFGPEPSPFMKAQRVIGRRMTPGSMSQALKTLQWMYNVPETGRLDADTMPIIDRLYQKRLVEYDFDGAGLGAPDADHNMQIEFLVDRLRQAKAAAKRVRSCADALELLRKVYEWNGAIDGHAYGSTARLTWANRLRRDLNSSITEALAFYLKDRCLRQGALGAAPSVPRSGLGAAPSVPRSGLGAADARLCDVGGAQIMRLAEVVRTRPQSRYQQAAAAIISQWGQLSQLPPDRLVCFEIAEVGRRAEALARFIAAES